MRFSVTLSARLVIAALFMAVASVAWAAPRNPVQEAAVDKEVAAVDATLVQAVHDANDATDRGDLVTAAREYAEVHERAPNVAAITRRLCTSETRTGKVDEGIAHCREALSHEESPENAAALATVLLLHKPMSLSEGAEAIVLARRAAKEAPNEIYAFMALCQVELATKGSVDACSARLQKLAPTAPTTHFYKAIAHAEHDDVDGAFAELDAAHAAGLDDATYQSMHAELETHRTEKNARIAREQAISPWTIITAVIGSWIALLFVIFVLGMLLSDSVRPSRGKISMLYKIVLRLAAWLFWPSAMLSTLILAYGVFRIGWTFLFFASAPRWAQAAVGAVGLYVVVATIRALFGRVADRDLGARVELKKQKALRDALEEIAIDEVWLSPDASIEVVRRDGSIALVIGAGALTGLSRRSLLAIATCELAALTDRATMWRVSLDALSDRMEARGVSSNANPVWWFVRSYRAFYFRISAGAKKVQAAGAEKIAKSKFGATALAEGRAHVEARIEEMSERVADAITSALDGDSKEHVTFFDDEAKDDDAWSLFEDRAAIERDMNARLSARLRERAGFSLDQGDDSSASSEARA